MTNCDAWIARLLEADPPRAKSLVMTVFGDAIVPHGGRLWLGSLIELAAPLGLTERLVRTSVFRLVQEGWLEAAREGRRSSYALAPSARARFERANARVYAPPRSDWDGQWTLLLAPAGMDAVLRTNLRRELAWEGFASLAPGLLAHPAFRPDDLAEILGRVDGAGQLVACRAADLPGSGARALGELVHDAWDLAGVAAGYEAFIDGFAPLRTQLEIDATSVTPEGAFVLRSLLVHAYRRAQLHDPMLPLALLPEPWAGAQAFALAQTLYGLLREPAERHLMMVLRREDPATPEADAAFQARFGNMA